MGVQKFQQALPAVSAGSAMREADECELATAAELMFFRGAPLAHVVDYCEHLRMENISRRHLELARRTRKHQSSPSGSIFRGWESVPSGA